jgi:hypothetical protein
MLLFFAMAVMVLASPPQFALAKEFPKDALFQALSKRGPTDQPQFQARKRDPEQTPAARMRGWLDQLAVVKPPRPVRLARPPMQMFVTLAPVGGHLAVCAIGSF